MTYFVFYLEMAGILMAYGFVLNLLEDMKDWFSWVWAGVIALTWPIWLVISVLWGLGALGLGLYRRLKVGLHLGGRSAYRA